MQRYQIENKDFQHECRIRDFYVQQLLSERPDERQVSTEQGYSGSLLRADLRTVDKNNLLREWEFKIWADYRSLGQILTYIALARHRENFARPIRGVIAAFGFQDEMKQAIEIMNLGIEIVAIPQWMAQAGGVPVFDVPAPTVVEIPANFQTQAG